MTTLGAGQEPRHRTWVLLAGALGSALLFAVLVTSNAGGYRYGVGDQAFYIPAIDRALSPQLFPRDGVLLDMQSRLLASDDLIAWVSRATGAGLPGIFFTAYLLTVALFAAGVFLVGSRIYRSPWTMLALLLALSLRHRIADTGVNTFEGYFHPRVLAFSLGVLAVGALLRERRLLAGTLAGTALVAHPTTGLWFVIWIGAAAMTTRRGRQAAAVVGVCAGLAAAWMMSSGPLAGSLRTMDPAWTAAFAEKDYLFPTDWPTSTWLTNAIAPVTLCGLYAMRQRSGIVSPAEGALFKGCLALLAVFALSLPFVHARMALAVQLQVSRVLWPVEFLATAYLVWALIEGPWPRWCPPLSWRAAVVVGLVTLAGAARGYYVLRAEHTRPLIAAGLPDTAWQETADWVAAHTPFDAHFIVDPGHAWKQGVSFRVAARRDVLLEVVKDAAMATYSRDIALRVRDRIERVGDFSMLTGERVAALARLYQLDYLIAERPYPFPLVCQRGPFRVYDLRGSHAAPAASRGGMGPPGLHQTGGPDTTVIGGR